MVSFEICNSSFLNKTPHISVTKLVRFLTFSTPVQQDLFEKQFHLLKAREVKKNAIGLLLIKTPHISVTKLVRFLPFSTQGHQDLFDKQFHLLRHGKF